MNHSDMTRYRNWSNDLYERNTERILKAIKNRVDTDERITDKAAMHAMIGREMPAPGDMDDIVAFKESLLAAYDEPHYLMGVMVHNGLRDLYVEDYEGDVYVPNDVENEQMQQMIQSLRKKETADFEKPDEVYVTPETLAYKSDETRGRSKGKMMAKAKKEDSESKTGSESKGED